MHDVEHLNSLFLEADKSYQRCQNKIIFDYYLNNQKQLCLSQNLTLPPITKPQVLNI